MKKLPLIFILLVNITMVFSQNIRWEMSGHIFSTFNSVFERGTPSLTSIRHWGLRVGASPNLTTDIQLGIRYQQRVYYQQSMLLTATAVRRAPLFCRERTLTHESSGVEAELLYRIRSSQFNRLHAFFGGGLAILFPQALNDYDQEIEQVEIGSINGQPQLVECGFPERAFSGSQLSMVFAPGIRLRVTHQFHLELETQFRYFPLRNGDGVGGLGINMVYNFY